MGGSTNTRAIALACTGMVAACLFAWPAFALVINIDSIAAQAGSGFTLRDRFGVGPSTIGSALVSHIINIDDCLYYQSLQPSLGYSWTCQEQSQVPRGVVLPQTAPSCATRAIRRPDS